MKHIAKQKRFNKKQERIYFSLAVAIILLSLIINITGFSETQTSSFTFSLISDELSFPINKDSEKIKAEFNLITGKVVEEVYNFGLPSPVENTVTSTSTTSTTAENEFGIPNPNKTQVDKDEILITTTSTSTSSTTINKEMITQDISSTINDTKVESTKTTDTSNLSIKSSESSWVITKQAGNEDNFKVIFVDIKDKNTDICFVLKEGVNGAKVDLSDKQLYNRNGTSVLDDKNKEITLKYEAAKCNDNGVMKDGYYISLTNAQSVNIDDYIQLGNSTLVMEYQETKLINYQDSWFDLNIQLFANTSNKWDNIENKTWIKSNNKFGADFNATNETTYFHYQINSTVPILKKDSFTYYLEKTETNPSGGIFTQQHKIDFGDICAVELTLNESEDIIDSFDPKCVFNLYIRDSPLSTPEYLLNVTFYANYDSIKGLIDIDPTISVDTTTSAQAIDTNITREANFNHLTLNDSSLILYIPFDTNTSLTTVYDYTSKNNDGTVTGSPDGIRWNYSGYFGGGYIINQSIKSYIQLPDIVAGQKQITVNMWFRSNVDNTSTTQTLLEQIGAGRDPISLQRNNAERYTFVIDNGTVQSTALINYDDTLVDTDWHMITGIYNGTDFGSKASLYIDGSFGDSGGNIGGNITHAGAGNNLFIGADSTADSSLNGTIDEVMIWNRTLTAQEITDLYRNQSARFVTQGKQEFLLINMTADQTHDRANITYFGQNLSGSYLQSRLGQWNITYGYNNTDTGLVGYWHFDNLSSYGENDTYVYDFATGGNNGTAKGNAQPTNSSDATLGLTKFGGSFKFDGNGDYVKITDSDSLSPLVIGNNATTISAWIYPISSTDLDTILIKGSDGSPGWEYWIRFSPATRISASIMNTSAGTAIYSINPSTTISTNTWTHIAFTVDRINQNATLYFNGVVKGSVKNSTLDDPSNGVSNLLIGGRIGQRFFNGTIDEVAIWNRSLSSEEIKSLYIKGRLNYDYTTPINSSQQTTELNGNTTYIDTHTLNVTNITQLIPEIWYFAGNSTINPFYSPILLGNFTVSTYITTSATTTTTSSSSTLPHANLTLYLRNSTGVELYKNITALTNESINITSVFP
ncbi:LamG domain-containing protein, partial [Candidatus Woesearchaeota archaeon]|nr:LamG domain-containing protein [Candidatus Woesearchaeota archaeon]